MFDLNNIVLLKYLKKYLKYFKNILKSYLKNKALGMCLMVRVNWLHFKQILIFHSFQETPKVCSILE